MRVLGSILALVCSTNCLAVTTTTTAFVMVSSGVSVQRNRGSGSIAAHRGEHESSILAASSSSSSEDNDGTLSNRRNALSNLLAAGGAFVLAPAASFADEDSSSSSFAEIQARAKQISQDLEKEATQVAVSSRKTDKTAYDFSMPVAGQDTPFAEIIRQETLPDGDIKVKAILVVNIKQDDTIARKTIPGLISLASKYGGSRGGNTGGLTIVACPTDQGYFEPDTSQLIRLKLASEYGYGINPSTTLTDKVNLLGTGAHPFWRWLQSNCRTPAGLGRIEGNFEKFLVDGRTGLPVRRYPRKYAPSNIAADIEAVLAGKPVPPAQANWLEEWRAASVEAEANTYRFQKGLNYFDQ